MQLLNKLAIDKGSRSARAILAVCLVIVVFVLATAPRSGRAGTNPRYFAGDWTAYTSVRYVNSVVETFEFMYLGTDGGIARYDRFEDRWLPPFTTADGLPSNEVQRLAYNSATDELYAKTPLGVAVYRTVAGEWYDTPEFPDDLTRPWEQVDLSEYYFPIGFDALEPGILTDQYLRTFQIVGGIRDSHRRLWIGTWGAFVWTKDYGTFNVVPDRWGLYNEDVAAVYLDSNALCFGGQNYYGGESGFTVYDRKDDEWHYYESRYIDGFESDYISRVVGKPGGRYLWLATDRGVVRFDRRNEQFKTINRRSGLGDEEIWSLCLDGEILWIGSETGVDGIYLPSDSVFSATTDAINGARIYDIDVTGDIVWLGTDRGLFRLVKPTPFWQRFSQGEGPTAGRVRTLTHDDENLYVGSDRGIAIIDLEGLDPIEVFESPSILPDENIFDLAVTDSILWAATRSGLLRFVPATHERRVFTTFDGMLDDLVEAIVVDGDYLWLGTIHGANRFRWNSPQRID